MRRDREQGMVLVTVLLLIGVATAALAIMLTGEDAALSRATRLAGAAQAMADARGGELSAVTALRRDMIDGPQSDDASEPWAKIGESGARIDGGGFRLAIADATGRLDLNAVARGDQTMVARLVVLEKSLQLGEGAAQRIANMLTVQGPIADIAELGAAGLDPQALARLATVATALPTAQPLNLNAAPEAVLALLLDDPIAARSIAARRQRAGKLTPQDFMAEGIGQPGNAGFTSAFYWVRTEAKVSGAAQQLTSLLARRRDAQGNPQVVVIGRWPGRPPLQAPNFPTG